MIRKIVMVGMLVVFVSVTTSVFADEVFVTQKGSKYHKEICRLIKGKKDLSKVDKEGALKGGYTPCKKCFSEDLAVGMDKPGKDKIQEKTKG